MTYAERLAEFVRVTGHKPGEMNKAIQTTDVGRLQEDSAGEPIKVPVAARSGTATPGMKQGHGGSHAAPAVNVDLSRGVAVGLTGERAIINLAPSEGNSTDEPQDEGSTTGSRKGNPASVAGVRRHDPQL